MAHCQWCKFSNRVRRTMKNGSRSQMRKLITELVNRLIQAEDSLEYNEAVLHGDWPSSVEILERRLEIARVKAKINQEVAQCLAH